MFQQEFAGSTEQLASIRAFVARAAKALGGSEDDVFACELSADEAASNAFEHAYAESKGRVHVQLEREGDDLVLSLVSWGDAFDPNTVPAPNLGNKLDERTLGGLGLFLMHKMMDDVSFHFDPVAGNRVTMRRALGKRAR